MRGRPGVSCSSSCIGDGGRIPAGSLPTRQGPSRAPSQDGHFAILLTAGHARALLSPVILRPFRDGLYRRRLSSRKWETHMHSSSADGHSRCLTHKRRSMREADFSDTREPWRRATQTPATKPLAGKVAVVAGATRGAAGGSQRMLGEAGATRVLHRAESAGPGRTRALITTRAGPRRSRRPRSWWMPREAKASRSGSITRSNRRSSISSSGSSGRPSGSTCW